MGSAVCSCKVGSATKRWDLAGVHDELASRWIDGEESVRDLAGWFNRRLLRAGFERAGRIPIDGETGNLYRVLTAENVDAGDRERARERLRQEGVSIGEIEASFVSHQTLYRHLRNCLDCSYERDAETAADRIDGWRDRIRTLRARTAAVTDRGVGQLADRDAIDIGEFDVLVDITVTCNDCGAFYGFEELLDGRGCECGSAAAEE